MKGLGAAAAAGVGLAAPNGPTQEAQAFAPAIPLAAGMAVGAAGTVAYSYVFEDDSDEIAEALDYQEHVEIYTRAYEEAFTTEELIASLSRDVELIENKAREEAIFRVYEQGVDSGSESDAHDAAEEAIDDAFATVQRSILSSWNAAAFRAEAAFNSIANSEAWPSQFPDNNGTYALRWMDNGTVTSTPTTGADTTPSGFQAATFDTDETTLYDGSPFEYQSRTNSQTSTPYRYVRLDPFSYDSSGNQSRNGLAVRIPDDDDYDTVDQPIDVPTDRDAVLIDASQYGPLLDDLDDLHDDMLDEVDDIVDTYFQPAQDGEVDLHQMIGPKHLTDTASEAEDYQESTMALRGMGYPISEQVVEFSMDDEPDMEFVGRLAWTAHDGNSLPVGGSIDPDTTVGSVFAAINVEDDDGTMSGEIVELLEPFTIHSAEGASAVSFEDRDLVEADNTDQEKVQQVFEQNYEANQEAKENTHDTATGGGGGLPDWDELGRTEKLAAVVVTGGLAYGVLK